jgi:hypothetical protein
MSLNGYTLTSEVKNSVQKSMKNYVDQLIKGNGFLPIIYRGKVLKLKLKLSKKYPDGFHSGVKSKGLLYTSCADFYDKNGNSYDIDFLVSRNKDTYSVVQPIVHSINGKKNKYDLKH